MKPIAWPVTIKPLAVAENPSFVMRIGRNVWMSPLAAFSNAALRRTAPKVR